ncbi:MAG: hypothetical protein Q8N96_12055, partial [Methylovulum sp.]|nr:hypothetical protein [Methylovulum sp.]
ATLERCRMSSHAGAWELYGNSQKITTHDIVPTLQRGNAACDAPASRNAGALPNEFPRRSVGTIWHGCP